MVKYPGDRVDLTDSYEGLPPGKFVVGTLFENRGTVYFADSCDDVASYAKPREWATRTAKVLADEAKAERDAAANVPLPLTLAEVFE